VRPITAVRIWYGLSAFFIVGWIANLVVVLRRPVFNWRDAASLPLLLFTFISLNALEKAHRKFRESPEVVINISAGRYMLAGLVVAFAVVCILLGYSWQRHIMP
jgi:hypothetical protein